VSEGFFVPKVIRLAFSNALKYMVDSDYLLDKRRFIKAREVIIENYSIRRLINNIEALYERLLIGVSHIDTKLEASYHDSIHDG
jgi:glycosyltransferase involved in cell wall biosynthesis